MQVAGTLREGLALPAEFAMVGRVLTFCPIPFKIKQSCQIGVDWQLAQSSLDHSDRLFRVNPVIFKADHGANRLRHHPLREIDDDLVPSRRFQRSKRTAVSLSHCHHAIAAATESRLDTPGAPPARCR